MKALNGFLFVVFLLFFGQCSAEPAEVKKLLFNTLQPVISESVQKNTRIIKYCPDNLCLSVESSDAVNVISLYEFTVLFFFYEANFPEFRNKDYLLPSGINPRGEFESIAPTLLDKYASGYCDEAKNKNKCVLQHMRAKYGIKTFFTRTDEGEIMRSEIR